VQLDEDDFVGMRVFVQMPDDAKAKVYKGRSSAAAFDRELALFDTKCRNHRWQMDGSAVLESCSLKGGVNAILRQRTLQGPQRLVELQIHWRPGKGKRDLGWAIQRLSVQVRHIPLAERSRRKQLKKWVRVWKRRAKRLTKRFPQGFTMRSQGAAKAKFLPLLDGESMDPDDVSAEFARGGGSDTLVVRYLDKAP
jgi:hypothetical protein